MSSLELTSTSESVPVEEKEESFFTETDEQGTANITPGTRRLIIASLAIIALVAIIAEVVLVVTGNSTSDALLTIAATAVGGLAGLAMPSR